MSDNSDLYSKLLLAVKRRVRILNFTGAVITVIGCLLFFGFSSIVEMGLKSQMQIKEGNDITKNWANVPLAITIKIYIWNIENPLQLSTGAKPILTEKGPYVWNQHRWKEIINWGPNDETITYWSLQSFTFDSTRTKGSLNDKITVINVPVYAMAYVIKSLVDQLPMSFVIAPIAFNFANILFNTHGERLIKVLTVGQLVEGYPFSILDTIDTLTKPLSWFGIQLPDTGMPDNKFGLLSVKNHTKSGPYEVYTGQGGSADKFLKFVSYKGKKTLDFYNEYKCNLMNGTDGSTMGSFLTRDKTLYVFQGDACKSFHSRYKEDTTVRGISTYRFILPESLFASPDKYPDNKCFCTTPNNYAKCDGIFDLGPCQKGAPLAFSFPHFLYASSTIRQSVVGMAPDIEKHESFFDVEPTLGAPLRASGKLQVNVLLKPISLLPGFGNVREAVIPYVWLEEFAEIDDKFEGMIKTATIPIAAIHLVSILMMLIGLVVVTTGIGYGLIQRYKKYQQKSDEKQKTNDENESEISKTSNDKNVNELNKILNENHIFESKSEEKVESNETIDEMKAKDFPNHSISSAITQTPDSKITNNGSVFTISQRKYDKNFRHKSQTVFAGNEKINIDAGNPSAGIVKICSPPGEVE